MRVELRRGSSLGIPEARGNMKYSENPRLLHRGPKASDLELFDVGFYFVTLARGHRGFTLG